MLSTHIFREGSAAGDARFRESGVWGFRVQAYMPGLQRLDAKLPRAFERAWSPVEPRLKPKLQDTYAIRRKPPISSGFQALSPNPNR